MNKLVRVAAIVAMVCGAFFLGNSPAQAVNGCIPSEPANPQYGSACSFVITPGGDYNASSAGASYSITITAADGTLVRTVTGGSGRTTIIPAAEAETLAGGPAPSPLRSPGGA